MFARGKRILSFLLAIILFFQLLSGCSSTLENENSGEIQEDKIYEDWIYSSSIPEEQLQAQYIAEHLIYEEGLYEIVIGEQYLCQTYLIETVITSTSENDFVNQLPQEVLDYGIDWRKVISKFAVGTAVIIAVGVVNHAKDRCKEAKKQVKRSLDLISSGALPAFQNKRGQCVYLQSDAKIIPLVVFDNNQITDYPHILRKHLDSGMDISCMSFPDYCEMCRILVTPMEIIEYTLCVNFAVTMKKLALSKEFAWVFCWHRR